MFILASASPRRQELLRIMGCIFQVRVSEAEELAEGRSPRELAVSNAGSKALAVASSCPEVPVLGADTVVALEHQIYGKPKNTEEASAMLHQLSNRTHEVITGIAFAWRGKLFVDAEATKVQFGFMTDREIRNYVATGEPMDKAGAYALQGRAEAFIEGIQGSWSNVVGLPLYRVRMLAQKAGIDLYGEKHSGIWI